MHVFSGNLRADFSPGLQHQKPEKGPLPSQHQAPPAKASSPLLLSKKNVSTGATVRRCTTDIPHHEVRKGEYARPCPHSRPPPCPFIPPQVSHFAEYEDIISGQGATNLDNLFKGNLLALESANTATQNAAKLGMCLLSNRSSMVSPSLCCHQAAWLAIWSLPRLGLKIH